MQVRVMGCHREAAVKAGESVSEYRKKPVVIEATQWFKMGDHADVEQYETPASFRSDPLCGNKSCGQPRVVHGWVTTLEGGHIVCPGDWIITGVKGESYPCKPDIFEMTYDAVSATENEGQKA